MLYPVDEICEAAGGRFVSKHSNARLCVLVCDSRQIQQPECSLFFAIVTPHNDGHRYLQDAYRKGIRNFVISKEDSAARLAESNIILVDDTLEGLQKIAGFHRSRFNMPVIGITGSNGKTIVKEWLFQLLQEDYNIVRSPKSYNSQIGVPLSVWEMNTEHSLALFEAGISAPGEMHRLQNIIRPTIGVLTNLGEAHNAGFSSMDQKLAEKLELFKDSQVVIGPHELLVNKGLKTIFSIGQQAGASLQVVSTEPEGNSANINAVYSGEKISISIPFADEASIQNALTCWAVLLYLRQPHEEIRRKFKSLHTVDMRLQLRHGINNCVIINDSYSADTTSLKLALDFLQQQGSGLKRTVILSEFFESGKTEETLYREIIGMLKAAKVNRLIAVGEKLLEAITTNATEELTIQFYASTENLLQNFRSSAFADEIILIKGARRFQFERIAALFEKKLHQTVLEINLSALAANLKEYQKLLKPSVKVMAMVKAFSYGSGSAEIASVLQFHKTDYLGVAYADEGVELVKAGISIPIMVMNAEVFSFHAIIDYNLQPVIYSFNLLKQFESFLSQQGLSSYPVHIEIDTGMNRLGFKSEETEALAEHIASSGAFRVQSVFSHLAASEDREQDSFTLGQHQVFMKAVAIIEARLSYSFTRHIANSAAIVRHPQLQMDMVRLGIGLYGIEVDNAGILDLKAVATLRSTVAQLHRVQKGESVSYNRRGMVERDSIIATVRIGYADGYSRRFGNGVGRMLVNGKPAPVMGSVCMDMTMIDVTGIEGVKEGDDVIVFGEQLPVQQLAERIQTIPYEIMTGVSQRVKRVYYSE